MKTFFLILFISLFSNQAYSQAKIFIDVGEARVRKSLLALPDFQYMGAAPSSTARKAQQDVFAVIKNDLDVTGLFQMMDPDSFLEDPAKVGLRPKANTPDGFDFNNWKTIGTEFLIRGGFQVSGDNVTLEIYAYYIPQGKLVLGKKYNGPLKDIRKIAHTFSYDFVHSVTGKPSFFLSQIVVCIDGGAKTHREVYLTDWDGANSKAITKHSSITISPDWSKDGKHVAYTAYVKRRISGGKMERNPDLFIYEVPTGKRWLVSYRKGLNSGANFMPDGKNLLLTLSQGKTANIYKMSLDGKTITQITNGPGLAMNVEPAISPRGDQILFSSDRSGRPMVYTMDLSGRNVKRRTFAGHYNSTPTWSPDGKRFAFAGFDKDKSNFDIFVMNVDGTGLMRLTRAKKANGKWANNEDPAFSPDGRHVLFISDRTGTKQIYMVNTDGTNERRITYDDKYYSKPKWGPLIRPD